jgi:hypothetical protein
MTPAPYESPDDVAQVPAKKKQQNVITNEQAASSTSSDSIFCPPSQPGGGTSKLSKNARRALRRKLTRVERKKASVAAGKNASEPKKKNGKEAQQPSDQKKNKRKRGNSKGPSASTNGTTTSNANQVTTDDSKPAAPAPTKKQKANELAAKKLKAKEENAKRVHFRPSRPEVGPNKVLIWTSSCDYVPLANEEAMRTIVYRGRQQEYGMLENATSERLNEIQARCVALNMTFNQASSLRSHYLMKHNRFMNVRDKLGLLSEAVNREAAEIFEECIAAFLEAQDIPYMDENEQKRIQPQGSSTPDNLLRETVDLKWKNDDPYEINWVECKMFYAASTIPLDNKSAVGRLLTTARKYVDKFGPGAIVFASGCGDEMATKLRDVGVIALDSDSISLERLEAHRILHSASLANQIPPQNHGGKSNNHHNSQRRRGGNRHHHRR